MPPRKPPPSGPAPRTGAVVERKDGSQLRRTTIYFPEPLARQLRVYCAEHNFDMSSVVSEALKRYLAGN